MIDLVDTHCHIQSIKAKDGEKNTIALWSKAPGIDADDVIKRASENGVNKLICVGCNYSDSLSAVEFTKNRDNCYAAVGIHPHDAKHYVKDQSELSELSSLATSNKVVAIGECGLDYYYLHSNKEDQKLIFKHQIELALHSNLPLIFHVRDAFDDFWQIIDNYKNIRGVVHSFTDSLFNMQKAISKGLFIGVNGIATFAKNPDQLAVYKAIPSSSLVLETDSPYLTPAPYRGSINEPKYTRVVAEFLADLRNESLEELSFQTTSNAEKLFEVM